MKRILLILLMALSSVAVENTAHSQDTFTSSLCLDRQPIGGNTNSWGGVLNSNLDIIDAASEGIFTLNIAAGGTFTLTTNCSTVPDQSRNQHFVLTGALASNATILFPSGRSRAFSVFNNTTGAFTVTLCANTGGGVCAGTSQNIAQGQTHGYISDGTNVSVRESSGAGGVQIGGDLGGTNTSPTVISTHLGSPLPVAQGGTGQAAAGATAANAIGALAIASNLSDLNSVSSARVNLGLGTAALLNAGSSANNAVQLDGTGRLPAVDGSQLTNLPNGQTNFNLTVAATHGSFTYTPGTNEIRDWVRCVGPGGGGAGVNNGFNSGAGGGGAGAYAEAIVPVTPGTPIAVTIGAGGAGGSSLGSNGGNGSGPTSFGTAVIAGAGFGGVGGGSINAGNGGTASAGTLLLTGGAGSFGSVSGTTSLGGAGGSTVFGGAGFGGAAGNAGGNGIGFGAGGGGGSSTSGTPGTTGGNGADGACIVMAL